MCVEFSFDDDGNIQATRCPDCVCHLDFPTERTTVLTKIAAVTGLLTLLVQGAVLFGVDLSGDQQAWLTTFIVAAGAAVHSWFNPALPGGPDA